MNALKVVLLLLVGALLYEGYETLFGSSPVDQIASLIRAKPAPTTPVVAAVPRNPAPAPKPASTPPAEEAPLVLSAPPRETPEDGKKRYGPLADYLAGVLHRRVIYKHPQTWGGYQSDMQAGRYDIVFDGPHFVSWRIEKLGHNVLVKLPGNFLYVGFVPKDTKSITRIEQLAGKTVCVHAPPNLGTLMLLKEFEKTVRQPQIAITEGYRAIYDGVVKGDCVAAMLPANHLKKYDKDAQLMRVIYSHPPYPQQAVTAGPRLSADEQIKITDALLVSTARDALSAFRDVYALSGWFTRAENSEYEGLSSYLALVQGF